MKKRPLRPFFSLILRVLEHSRSLWPHNFVREALLLRHVAERLTVGRDGGAVFVTDRVVARHQEVRRSDERVALGAHLLLRLCELFGLGLLRDFLHRPRKVLPTLDAVLRRAFCERLEQISKLAASLGLRFVRDDAARHALCGSRWLLFGGPALTIVIELVEKVSWIFRRGNVYAVIRQFNAFKLLNNSHVFKISVFVN